MAATNVQAFPGDVTISSNLAVDTNTLFVDSVGNKVGIGTNAPISSLHVFKATGVAISVESSASGSFGSIEMGGPQGAFLDFKSPFSDDYDARLIYNVGQGPNGQLDITGSNVAIDSTTLFVDSVGNKVGIGTTAPISALDIDGGPNTGTIPAFSIRGGIHTTSDLYVLNSYDVETGVGFGAKVIGMNIKNKVETDNTVKIRANTGGLTAAGAIYFGSDDRQQGIFGVLGGDGDAGTTLTEMLTIRGTGRVGIGTTNPVSQLDVEGAGQTATATFNQAGALGGTLALRDSGTSSGNGGAIMFGAGQGFWAAIKGNIVDGTTNTTGALSFFTRKATGDSTMKSRMTITEGGRIGIGTNAPGAQLEVFAATTAAPLTTETTIMQVKTGVGGSSSNHTSYLGIVQVPESNPATWQDWSTRIQMTTDSSKQGYIEFNPPGGDNAIAFGDSADENMRITGGGYVGIGTTNPGAPLTIKARKGNINASGMASLRSNAAVRVNAFSSSTDTLLMGHLSTDTAGDSGDNPRFYIQNVWDNSTTGREILINPAGGNVGIGTNAPTAKLHIKASGTGNPEANGLYVYNTTSGSGDAIISARVLGAGGDPYLSLDVGGVLGWSFGIDSSDSNKLKWNPYWNSLTSATKMTLDTSGGLGLGTDAPDYHLTIKGTAKIYDSLLAHMYLGNEYGGWGLLTDNTSATGGWNHNLSFYGRTAASGNPFQRLVLFENDNANQTDTGVVGSFTGQHRCFMENVTDETAITYEGLIVSANRDRYINLNGPALETGLNAIRVSESIPLVSISQIPKDKTCFGVISSVEDPETREERSGRVVSSFTKECGDTRIFVNSLGEGAIWVTNMNGNLESGDYITTSTVAGYGQKQDTEFLANYTVAKITMGCNFNPATQPVKQLKKELGDVKYWVKTVYESVSKEEYSNLTEENRTTTTETVYTNGEGEITTERYNTLETTVQSTYSELSRIIYQKVSKETSMNEQNGWELEISQEMVNILNEYGQIQWEDHATETEKAYKIRYLDANGVITDEANTVHTAAFVGCTYHCG